MSADEEMYHRAAEDLAGHRRYFIRPEREPRRPMDGALWFDEPGVCSICGATGRTYRDHCHETGLLRGRLCGSCNIGEAFGTGPMWFLWRTTAPWLDQRKLYNGPSHYDNRRNVTDEDRQTLTMPELLSKAVLARRQAEAS